MSNYVMNKSDEKKLKALTKQIEKLREEKEELLFSIKPKFDDKDLKEYESFYCESHFQDIDLDVKSGKHLVTKLTVTVNHWIEDGAFMVEVISVDGLDVDIDEISEIPVVKKEREKLNKKLKAFETRCEKKYGKDFLNYMEKEW